MTKLKSIFYITGCLAALTIATPVMSNPVLDEINDQIAKQKQENAYNKADEACLRAFVAAFKAEKDPQQKEIIRAKALQYKESTKADPAMRGKCPFVIPGSENFDAVKASEKAAASSSAQ